ncbi:hypothetical protein [Paenibacillus glucanolyticus]
MPTSEVTTNNRNNDTLTVTKQYDDYGNVLQATNERGATITNTYDSSRHWLMQSIERVASGVDLHTTYTRNSQGDITELIVRQGHGTGQVVRHIQFGYDSYGNVTTETIIQGDKRSTVTTDYPADHQFSFPTRQRIPVKDADGNVSEVSVSSTYDQTTGNITSSTDARQQTTVYRYDVLGRVIGVTYPDHHTLVAKYDDINNTVTVTNELGQKTRTQWNALGWKLEEGILTDKGVETKSRTGYDPYGRTVWSEDALGQRTQTNYDSWGRQTITVSANATQTLTQYDDANRIQSTRDAEGNVHREYYDIYGQMVKSEEQTVKDQTGRLIVQQVWIQSAAKF